MKKLLPIICLCFFVSGCAGWIVRPTGVVLLPDERIFSIPAGQSIKVTLDKKEMDMIFPAEMKLVSPTILVKQEEKLNNALLDSTQAKQSTKRILTLVLAVLGVLGAVVGLVLTGKIKNLIPKKITATVESK
jgi:hypothetical protein